MSGSHARASIDSPRQSTGVGGLDDRFGGGLVPGTLTVVVGASGVGKTQFGLQYLHAGRRQEGRAGIIFDMSARIDPQCHAQYAKRMFDWTLVDHSGQRFSAEHCFSDNRACSDEIIRYTIDERGIRLHGEPS